MKDIFNRRQRFSLRKYSVGVCSVLLGTALFVAGAPSASAEEVTATPESSTETAATETASSTEVATETTTTESSNYEAPAPLVATSEPVTTASSEKAEATTETSKASEEEKKTEEASKEEKKTEDKKSEDKKSEDKKSEDKKSSTEAKTEKATTSATSEATTEATSSSEAAETETTSLAANPAVQPLNASANKPVADSTATTSATTLSAASTETATAGALETSRSRRRGRRAATDHNTEPLNITTYLKPGETADPNMTDPNGSTVRSQPIPAGYQGKDGDFYTYGIWDLTGFNARYGSNYYARVFKNFSNSTNSTIELIDKTSGTVIESHDISDTSGAQRFTTTTSKSNTQLTFKVDYQQGSGAGGTNQPFLQLGFEVGSSIQALVAHGHTLTPAEKILYDAVYDARNSKDIMNAVEPVYNNRTVTDTNFKIPTSVEKTTYYKVVDRNNPTFNVNKPNTSDQDYKENGHEEELAKYTVTAMEGQNFTASGLRQFDGYKLYQISSPDMTTGFVSRGSADKPYTVGEKFMDADRYGIKRIKEIVKEDGTVVVRVYLLDPRQQSKRSDGTLNTDGYTLLAETEPIAPGQSNTKPLKYKVNSLRTIAFTENSGTSYPNGKEVGFDFQTDPKYTPYKTVFVPFLGDGIGHNSPNSQLERGVNGIGVNVDLLNSLSPFTKPTYYYVKPEPVKVTPVFEKSLTGGTLQDGKFSFTLTETTQGVTTPHTQTVTNQNGKATFGELTFTKPGTYTYKVQENSDPNTDVDYDAMETTMTVVVTEKNAVGDLQATVTYTSINGQDASGNTTDTNVSATNPTVRTGTDTEFNNFVVAPVNVEFDFTKKLDGRKLQANEFTFNLLNEAGTVIGTAKNDANGNIKFTGIK